MFKTLFARLRRQTVALYVVKTDGGYNFGGTVGGHPIGGGTWQDGRKWPWKVGYRTSPSDAGVWETGTAKSFSEAVSAAEKAVGRLPRP